MFGVLVSFLLHSVIGLTNLGDREIRDICVSEIRIYDIHSVGMPYSVWYDFQKMIKLRLALGKDLVCNRSYIISFPYRTACVVMVGLEEGIVTVETGATVTGITV